MPPLITAQALRAFAPHCDAASLAPLLDAQAEPAGIVTGLRVAHWMAQMAVECAYFTHFAENLDYTAEELTATWPSRFPAAVAPNYAHQPVKIANRAYAGVNGNGDEASGDGWTFRGRGFLDHTGRANYAALQSMTGLDLVGDPVQLTLNLGAAAKCAAAFWAARRVNAIADSNDIEAVTRAVNGGINGLAARVVAFNVARKIWNG